MFADRPYRLHTFLRREGKGRQKRKMCKECYRVLRQNYDSREATKRVRRVTSYCQDCEGEPGFCLPCFNEYHKPENFNTVSTYDSQCFE